MGERTALWPCHVYNPEQINAQVRAGGWRAAELRLSCLVLSAGGCKYKRSLNENTNFSVYQAKPLQISLVMPSRFKGKKAKMTEAPGKQFKKYHEI